MAQETDLHNGFIHLDDVLIAYEEEKKIGSEFGKGSLEEYIKLVGSYLKIISDGE
jgi:hypothetical protein